MTTSSDSHTILWVPRFWPAVGGTEFHSKELAKHLSQFHRVTVLTHCTTTESQERSLASSAALTKFSETIASNVRIIELAPKPFYTKALFLLGKHHAANRFTRFLYQRIFTLAFRSTVTPLLQGADRIHFIYNGLTEASNLAAQQAQKLNIPFIFTPNILDTRASGSDWDTPSFHKLYKKSERLIALTQHEAQWLKSRGINENKISIIPYGPILEPRDPSQEKAHIAELLSYRYILFIGRLVPGKGSTLLLDAFHQLSTKDHNTKLVMICPSYDSTNPFVQSIQERLDNPRVHLLQDVSQPIKTALLEEARVLCVPSSKESLGGVYIEAMATSTPIIALDRPVSRCVIEHNKNGLLIANDKNSVFEALQTLLQNENLAEEMGCYGKDIFNKRYSWHTVTQNMLKVYAGDYPDIDRHIPSDVTMQRVATKM